MRAVAAEITAEDTGTDALQCPLEELIALSISGEFDATVYLQRSFDQGATWHDIEFFQAPVELNVEVPGAMSYRLYCKPGDYTSGTVGCRLQR